RVPELAFVLLEKTDVRVARQEPEILDDDVLPRDLFGREERKPLPEVDLVVDVERRDRIDARPVLLARPLLERLFDQVQINIHGCVLRCFLPPNGVPGRQGLPFAPALSFAAGFFAGLGSTSATHSCSAASFESPSRTASASPTTTTFIRSGRRYVSATLRTS